jgi:hypothetical protein
MRDNRNSKPRPCREHMPFKGHRTVAEIWEEERQRSERCRLSQQLRHAREYGYGG